MEKSPYIFIICDDYESGGRKYVSVVSYLYFTSSHFIQFKVWPLTPSFNTPSPWFWKARGIFVRERCCSFRNSINHVYTRQFKLTRLFDNKSFWHFLHIFNYRCHPCNINLISGHRFCLYKCTILLLLSVPRNKSLVINEFELFVIFSDYLFTKFRGNFDLWPKFWQILQFVFTGTRA